MKQIKLSNRLCAIAGYIGESASVVDVGTDHGYLPVWLAQNSVARRIAATDIREGPLARAQASAGEYGVSDRISFFLTDGLAGLEESYDTIVIAGMGGETIISILEAAPWTREGGVRLILQPQTKQDELTDWLRSSGYLINDASMARDESRLYLVFTAGAQQAGVFHEPLDFLLGKRDPLLPAYLTWLIKKTHRALEGLEKSVRYQAAEPQRRTLEKYVRIMEEIENWSR